ncbi:MAG: GNAT family N-acetyltransferase [Candidatus Lokiarchaeota archaeon]|nr:GNAT family N-acetyltransferase [Candidatus Lokiarchaeota archaeon]
MKMPEPGVYQEKWEKHVKLKDGIRVFIRPIKPEDRDLWVDFYLGLSKLSKYYRFFSTRPKPNEEMIKKYTDIDYVNNFALVGIIEEHGKKRMIGVARYVLTDKDSAEIAVVVADDWQGKGLGTKLLLNLLDVIIKRRIPKICGDVFLENDKMMQLMRDSKFNLVSENEAGVKHFEIDL